MNYNYITRALMAFCIITTSTAMEISEKTSAQDKDIFLIYSNNPNDLKSNGTYFSKDILVLSKTLNNMFFDDSGAFSFPEKETSIASGNKAIENAASILKQYEQNKDKEIRDGKIRKILDNYSFSDLIETSNCINILDLPQDINRIMLETIGQKLSTNSNNDEGQTFRDLNSDWKLSVIDPLKTWLRILQIQKYALLRKIIVAYDYVIPKDGGELWYHPLLANGKSFKKPQFLPDSSKIVTQKAHNIRVYDVKNKTHKNITSLSKSGIITYALSDNGKYIAYAEGNDDVYIQEINSESKTLLGRVSSRVTDLTFNKNGTQLAIGRCRLHPDYYNNIILWDISDLKNLKARTLKGHREYVWTLAFSPDGKMLASGGTGDKNNLKIWDTSTGNIIKEISAQADDVYKILFNPCGGEFISVGQGDCREIDNSLSEMYFTEDLRLDLEKARERTHEGTNFALWNIRDLNKISFQKLTELNTKYYIYSNSIITWSPDGKIVVVGRIGSDEGSTWTICNMSDPDYITYRHIPRFTDKFYSVAFSKDGKKMVSSNVGSGKLGIKYVYLADWDFFTDEKMFEDIINYDQDTIELLYHLRNNKRITKSSAVAKLPKEVRELLSELPNFPKKEVIVEKSLSSKFFNLKKIIPSWLNWKFILQAIKGRFAEPLYH